MPRGDREWYDSVLKTGTMRDKIAAHTLLVSACPHYRLAALRSLMTLVMGSGASGDGAGHVRKDVMVAGAEALVDLFVSNILPERKLKYGAGTTRAPGHGVR